MFCNNTKSIVQVLNMLPIKQRSVTSIQHPSRTKHVLCDGGYPCNISRVSTVRNVEVTAMRFLSILSTKENYCNFDISI